MAHAGLKRSDHVKYCPETNMRARIRLASIQCTLRAAVGSFENSVLLATDLAQGCKSSSGPVCMSVRDS